MSEFDDLYPAINAQQMPQPAAPPKTPSSAEGATTDEFDMLYQGVQQPSKIQENLLTAQDINPDEAAQRKKLSADLKTPEVLLPPTAEAQAELVRARNKPEDIAAESPSVARWLENVDNAKLTGGDTTSLRQLEHHVNTLTANSNRPMVEQIVRGIGAQLEDQIPGIKRGMRLDALQKIGEQLPVSAEERRVDIERIRARQDMTEGKAVPAYRDGAWRFERDGIPVDMQQRLVKAQGPTTPEGKARAVLQEEQAKVLNDWALAQKHAAAEQPDISSPLGRVLYGGLAGAIVSAPYMAATIAMPELLPLMFTGPVYTQALPKYLARGATANEAHLGAMLEGASASLTEAAPLGYIVKSLGKGGIGLSEFFSETLGREVPSEMLDTLISTVTDTAIANPNKTWGEAMAELPEELAIAATAALMISGGMAGVHKAAQGIVARAEASAQRAQQQKIFDKLREAAINEPVRERDTAAFRDLMAGMTEDNVYVSTQVITDIAKTPEGNSILANVPGLDTQVRDGALSGTVAIPVADYMAHIAGSAIDENLLPHLRLAEDGPTQAEAEGYLQSIKTEMQDAAKNLAEGAEPVLTREEFYTKQQEESVALRQKARMEATPAPQVPGVDRRKDQARRKTVAEMTHEERAAALLSDDLTGLGNRRAYEEAPRKARQAYLDVDALGVTNDKMGHTAGDQLLKAVGGALKSVGVEAYRIGGDEITAQHDDENGLRAQLEQARRILDAAEITATLPDGSTITRRGLGFSYGTGSTTEEADAALYKDKKAREQSGARAPKGQEPAGMVRRPAERGQAESQAPTAAQTYEQYLAQHGNQQAVLAADIEAVRTAIVDDLNAAGRFTKAVNEANAIPLRDWYTVQAARLGIKPSELLAQYPLRFRAEDIVAGYGQDLQLESAKADYDLEMSFADDIRGGKAKLEEFPYYNDYQATIDAEATLLQPGAIMFVGSGPIPLSPIMFARKGFEVTGMDISREAQEMGKTIAYKAGVEMPVVLADATTYDFSNMDTVVLALEAGANTELKRAILGNLSRTLRPGSTLLLRGSATPDFVALDGLLPDNMEIAGSVPTWGGLGETVAVKITGPGAMKGLPTAVTVNGESVDFGPSQVIRDVAAKYMADAGMGYAPPREFRKVDPARAKRIADAFEAMPHDPTNPEVKAAYDALARETLAQWAAIKATGLKVEFITGEDPYPNPRLAILDIVENNHLWVFPTTSGFGGGEMAGVDVTGNPLMAVVPREEISGRPVQINDIFRIVHDYFGHAKEGVGFRADGEENAWRIHSSMFSDLARKALTTETRGQNSWLNFGPYGEKNRTAVSAETQYAPQKTGLLPDWVVNEGVREGIEAIGVHFSKEPRKVLEGTHYGTGIKGAEAKRLAESDDPRIKTRLAFYVDEGNGVKPEMGLGRATHTARLGNLYDARSNALKLPSKNYNEFESAVIDAGYDGYYMRGAFGNQGAVVLLGEAAKSVPITDDYAQLVNIAANVSPMGFYSALEQTLYTAKQKKALAKDWINIIPKLAGVKKEELDVTGVLDWLETVDGTVAVEEILRFVELNGPVLAEAALGEDRASQTMLDTRAMELRNEWFDDRLMDYYPDTGWWHVEEEEDLDGETVYAVYQDSYKHDIFTDEAEAEREMESLRDGAVDEAEAEYMYELERTAPDFQEQAEEELASDQDDTSYSEWRVFERLGRDYNELLLTLPQNMTRDVYNGFRVGYQVRNAEGALVDEVDAEHAAKWKEKGYHVAEIRIPAVQRLGERRDTFRSSHWKGIDNVLAHVRTSTYEHNGEKLLLVEEIQSDWGQEGRADGFIGDPSDPGTLERAIKVEKASDAARRAGNAYRRYLDRLNEKYMENRLRDTRLSTTGENPPASQYFTEDETQILYFLRIRASAANDRYTALAPLVSGVPKGPFVTDTKSWTALAVKRLIRYAAENGHDRIVFPRGEQQVMVYSNALRKSVDAIEWTKTKEGVRIVGWRNSHAVIDRVEPESRLEAALGKAMAEEIKTSPTEEGIITGDALTIDSTGMHAYYDVLLPQVLNKISPQLGGSKIDAITLPYIGGENNSLEITPEMRARVMQGVPLFQEKRGSYNPNTLTINLMKGANLSTVHHEAAHFFLDALADMANKVDAPEDIKQDFDKVLKWFGVDTPAAWHKMTIEEKRPHHEQWAESYELYLLEGKAPASTLQPLFARFRAWMLAVYKSAKDFIAAHPAAGKLNDEIRGVYDRMLASADAIANVEAARGYAPLFNTAAEAGISQSEFDRYMTLGKEATDTAVQELERKSLRDMQWLANAKLRATKELTAEAKQKRATLRAEVVKEVEAEGVYAARKMLKDRNSGLKLHTSILREFMPDLDITLLRGMTSEENGTHPDQVANMFGFANTEALVDAMLTAEDMNDKIDGITDQRMLEQFGELVDSRAIERAANEAVHNEARARFLATGLRLLSKSPIPVRDLNKAAKMAAEDTIASRKVKDIKPAKYEAAEARASKEVLKLVAKNPASAAGEQRRALLNNRLARAAQDALSEVDKALRYFAKLTKDGTRKNIDMEYVEQIDAMLAPFNLNMGLSLKEIERRKSLLDWVDRQEANGFEPAFDVDTIEELKRKSYKDMTMEELRGLVEAIKQVEHLGRLKTKLLTAKDQREFAARIDEARASIEDNANRTVKEKGTPTSIAGLTGKWLRSMFAAHRKFASVMREMDGGKDNGVMYNLLLTGMNEAGDHEVEMRTTAGEALAKLFDPIMPQLKGSHIIDRPSKIPGTSLFLTSEQRLMFALNWGNEGNRQRLLDGGITGHRSLSEGDALKVLDTLTKDEWDFVQGVWDYYETFRPEIAKLEKELTGVEPEWVQATPVATKFGTYRGGYAPAKYDAELSTRSESLEAATNLRQAMKGAFNASATRKGYTQKRAAEVVGRPLLLSFNAISQHVSEVTHRLAWQRWLTDANRVLKALDGPIRDHYGAELLRELRNTVKDIAEGAAPATTPTERAINHLRIGSTIVGLGWRLTTGLLQPSGLSQSWSRIGGGWLAKGVGKYLANPLKTTTEVQAKSKMMRDRGKTLQREINEVMNVVRAGEKMSAIQASYFMFVTKFQQMVDMPTWLGAHEKALAQLGYENAVSEEQRKEIEDKAIGLADQAVRDSQGSGQLQDLAGVQRGSPGMKLFTNFYSYFNVTYNLNAEAFRRTSFKSPSQIGALAVDLLLINTLPVLYSVALRELLKGDCEWDLECMAHKLGLEQVNYMFGQMILLREAGTAVNAAAGEGYGYTGPAGLRFFADLYKVGQQAGQGEADLPLFKAANQVGGVLLHYPAGEVNTIVEAIMAMERGDIEGPAIIPAMIAGPPKQ